MTEQKESRIWKFLGMVGIVAIVYIIADSALDWKNTQYEIEINNQINSRKSLALQLAEINNNIPMTQQNLPFIRKNNLALANNGFLNFVRDVSSLALVNEQESNVNKEGQKE